MDGTGQHVLLRFAWARQAPVSSTATTVRGTFPARRVGATAQARLTGPDAWAPSLPPRRCCGAMIHRPHFLPPYHYRVRTELLRTCRCQFCVGRPFLLACDFRYTPPHLTITFPPPMCLYSCHVEQFYAFCLRIQLQYLTLPALHHVPCYLPSSSHLYHIILVSLCQCTHPPACVPL